MGGNTKTLMIACVSPAAYNYDETLSTLRYAARAKNIHNKPKINEDPKDALLREYQEQILQLKSQLSSSGGPSTTATVVLDDEKKRLETQYNTAVHQLRVEFDVQQQEKAELIKGKKKRIPLDFVKIFLS